MNQADKTAIVERLNALKEGDCSHATGEIWVLNKAISLIESLPVEPSGEGVNMMGQRKEWIKIGNVTDALLQAKEIIEEHCPHVLTEDDRGIAIEAAIAAMGGEAVV